MENKELNVEQIKRCNIFVSRIQKNLSGFNIEEQKYIIEKTLGW